MNINLENFKIIVDPVVYDRGLEYSSKDLILHLESIDSNNFNAVVSGTENYTVNITLGLEEKILTFECSCPFNSSPICKHIVAVLLLIKEKKDNNIAIPKGSLSKINNSLNDFSKEELSQLVLNLAKSNPRIKNKVLHELGIHFNK